MNSGWRQSESHHRERIYSFPVDTSARAALPNPALAAPSPSRARQLKAVSRRHPRFPFLHLARNLPRLAEELFGGDRVRGGDFAAIGGFQLVEVFHHHREAQVEVHGLEAGVA